MDFDTILAIVVVGTSLVISAVKALTKNATKAAEQEKPASTAAPEAEEDPWESIRRLFDQSIGGSDEEQSAHTFSDQSETQTLPEELYAEKTPWSYDSEAVSSSSRTPTPAYSFAGSSTAGDDRIEVRRAATQQPSPLRVGAPDVISESTIGPDVTRGEIGAEGDSGTEFMKRFNLRDAILYSEILKPKYQE